LSVHEELSGKVLRMAFRVHNVLGPGLLESCYQDAYCVELKHAGIAFEREKVFALYYRGECIGGYRSDLVVDNKIILQLKSVKELCPAMEAVAEFVIYNLFAPPITILPAQITPSMGLRDTKPSMAVADHQLPAAVQDTRRLPHELQRHPADLEEVCVSAGVKCSRLIFIGGLTSTNP
jgi:GxxExxY protein